MPRIQFPNVPSVPGVPALLKKAGSAAPLVRGALGILQGAIWDALKGKQTWGIYESKSKTKRLGEKTPNKLPISFIVGPFKNISQLSLLEFAFNGETSVSDFPVERGSFASYNKVIRPKMIKLVYAASGTQTDCQYFIDALETAKYGMTLFDVLTPSGVFKDYTVTGYSYQRTAESGSNMLIVDVNLTEIVQVEPVYIKTSQQSTAKKDPPKAPASPEAAKKVDTGKTAATVPEKGIFTKAWEGAKNFFNSSVEYANKVSQAKENIYK